MKYLISFLALFFSNLSAHSQNNLLTHILLQQQSRVKDTIFRLTAADSITAELPVTLISGARKGPTFTIVSGAGGMQYTSIMALLKLSREINPEKLSGNLIIIPVMNVKLFYRQAPFINKNENLSRDLVFPGSPTGTITEVIADFITAKVFDATDVFLDMRGGRMGEDLIPFISYYENQEFASQTKTASRLSEISGFSAIVSHPYVLESGQPALTALKQAVRLGIPALSTVIGRYGNCNKSDVSVLKDCVYRMMGELKMYENKKVNASQAKLTRYSRQAYVLSPGQGIFYSSVKSGKKITKDEEIGYITDFFGRNIQIVTAPQTGTVLYKTGSLPVNKGETLFCIGAI